MRRLGLQFGHGVEAVDDAYALDHIPPGQPGDFFNSATALKPWMTVLA